MNVNFYQTHPPPAMNASHSNKLDALTGLRAVAALVVFAHHFMGIMDCRSIRAPIGGVAVSFFFVLSGFILVYVYKDRLSKATTPKFYFTRFARIWPLHVVCLLLIACLIPKFLPPTELPWIRAFSHWSLLQAWYPVANWSGCYNGVAWSISAEAFFYLVFPLLLLGSSRQFWMKYACLFVVTFGAMIAVAYMLPSASSIKEIANASLDPKQVVHFFPPFRLLEFMTGMGAGMIFLNRVARATPLAGSRDNGSATVKATVLEVLVLALSLGCYHIFVSSGLFHYLHTIEDVGPLLKHWLSFSGGMFFHALVIYVFAQSAGWVGRLAGSRVMVFLGEISFAFYMIHYPLIYFVKQKFWFGSNFSLGYLSILAFTLTVAVSAWLYYLVEVPAKTTMLKWYSKNCSVRELANEMAAMPIRRLAKSRIIVVMILLIVIPVVVTKVYKRVDRKSFTAATVMKSASPEFQPILFGEDAQLLAVEVVPRRDSARVNTVWKFSKPGTAVLRIHFAGTDYGSREREIFCGPDSVGQPILTNMTVYEGKYQMADAVEVSLVVNGQDVGPKLSGKDITKISPNRHRIYSRENIQQGLRTSRLPMLTR